jgi:hypothetical protein
VEPHTRATKSMRTTTTTTQVLFLFLSPEEKRGFV